MEFAFNGLLRPEEEGERNDKFVGMKAFGVSKQKQFKLPMDLGIYAQNSNMFNVQKHINYFQNPKH